MESPFQYTQPVTGDCFIGRNKEINAICSMIKERNNILLIGASKSGKQSLMINAFERLKSDNYQFQVINFNLFNIRCVEAFLMRYANLIFSANIRTQLDWLTYKEKFIPTAPYNITTDSEGKCSFRYKTKELLTTLQIEELLELPQKFAMERGLHVIIYFRNFQDLLLLEDAQHFLKVTDNSWRKQKNVNYVISGDHYNAMNEIFHQRKQYYGFAKEFKLDTIAPGQFTEFLVKSFLKSGKVIQPDTALKLYNTVGRNPYYAQQLASIYFNLTRGYISENILQEGLNALISIYEFRFHYIICGLSRHQLRFLQAVMSGVTKFSSVDILEQYKLNSSANVNRVREALTKKEIISFNEKREGKITDPLFEYWLRKHFFTKSFFKA